MIEKQFNRWHTIVIPIILGAYLLPWIINTSTGLTLGAYDLAEWLSLHPATHPNRIPSLLLRGQLLLIVSFIAVSTPKQLFTVGWWLRCILMLILVVAQLPPPEFLSWTGDQNQRQQAILAIVSLIINLVGLSGLLYQFRLYINGVIISVGIISSGYILITAPIQMRTFGLSPVLGIGGFLLIGIYSILLAPIIYRFIKSKQGRN